MIRIKGGYRIVGINLIVAIAYNLVCKLIDAEDGFRVAFGLIIFHFFSSFLAGIICLYTKAYKSVGHYWILSAMLVLLVGVSTCFTLY